MKKTVKHHNGDELRYWLALTFIKDIGPVTCKRLLSAFGSPQKIFEARLNELKDIEDIGESRAEKILKFNSWNRVEKEIRAINLKNIRILKYTDKEYPVPLRQIDDSPVILYTKGNFIEEDKYAIAIVGSRRMTDYGRKVAETIAFEIASRGLTVISGMARGIDTSSHKGALKAGGRSIAVLGCGIDRPYPPENVKLLESLSDSGCVISEFPIGTPPNKENFPRRNRLISGLSMGVLVVEATDNSGSLITAQYALEQGKEVFAVPGNIISKNSEGTNNLIKNGAKLVQKTDDILEELSPVLKDILKSDKNFPERNFPLNIDRLEITDEEKAICKIIGNDSKHIDIIARESGMSPAELSGILLNLEMKGIIKQIEGKRFCMS
jgi:DNA processing protein